jgi:hypothetical protein
MANNDDIILAVQEQINELQPGLKKQIKIEAVIKQATNLKEYLSKDNVNVTVTDKILGEVIKLLNDIQSPQGNQTDFGNVLGDLDTLAQLISVAAKEENNRILSNIITQVEGMLSYRPDVQSVMSDLDALKNLKRGPADGTAFHDFNVLQIAFKSVWKHAYDKNIPYMVEQIFKEHTKLYDSAGLTLPPYDSITDIDSVTDFLNQLQIPIDPSIHITTTTTTISDKEAKVTYNSYDTPTYTPPVIEDINNYPDVTNVFPDSRWVWSHLSKEQQEKLAFEAGIANDRNNLPDERNAHKLIGQAILDNPDGPGGRIIKLVYKLGKAIREPYKFDVFAPYSYNFGLMLTYRQKWEPLEYQAGDLISTLPLAPGETRKYSKKVSVKRSRTEKEIEKTMSSNSYQSSETSRAEADIMKKTSTATNFKMSANGSFNIGIGSIDASSEFTLNNNNESVSNKKDFHEATLKAAQEYKLERSIEVDTTSSIETEETNSGEISNPNNEITVTYLFYELQRRYKIGEYLYRVRPVILVALEVPAPHEIDEAWLIQYQWIISRVLLDDSLRSGLNYLTSGFAGDEISISIIKANWEAQKKLAESLEGQVKAQLLIRNSFRNDLELQTLDMSLEEASQLPLGQKILGALSTGGISALFGDSNDNDKLEAYRKAAETRLNYAEQALADAQNKLKQATDTFQQATKDYAVALQNQFARHVAIDQLRIHVKQNILYYMQAIWSHKVADQTFFELYKLPIDCPESNSSSFNYIAKQSGATAKARGSWVFTGAPPPPTSNWDLHELVEVADIDNPLGFKGNYIIFPLKDDNYLTSFMKKQFIDEYCELKDTDDVANFLESFEKLWNETKDGTGTALFNGENLNQSDLKTKLEEYIQTARRSVEEIVIPTGQLFIEALPGSHPLLEDFKLLHRIEDVRKVKAEVRHAELENLRLAARLLQNQKDDKKDNLLEDPDIEKKIIVEGNASVAVNTGA